MYTRFRETASTFLLSVSIQHAVFYFAVSCLLLAFTCSARAQDNAEQVDREILKKAGIATDGKALLSYIRSQQATRKKVSPAIIKSLIRQLKNGSLYERRQAIRYLIPMGRAALPYLLEAANDTSIDGQRDIQECIKKIESQANLEANVAAVRLVSRLRPKGTLEALLDFLPKVDDSWLEEEILRSLGRLGLKDGKVDPALMEALKDPLSPRRAGAGYVLASRGGAKHRQIVRQLLGDDDTQVRNLVIRGLLGKHLVEQHDQMRASDIKLLDRHAVGVTEQGLVQYLHKLSLDSQDVQRIRTLIEQLGNVRFRLRTQATDQLTRIGTPGLPFLKEALGHEDLEVSVRAGNIIDKIQEGPGPALPAAAIRRLTDHPSAAAIRALLAYVPFAENDELVEQVFNSLCLISVRRPGIDPQLVAALKDSAPRRRAAAAYVLGTVGTEAECRLVDPLLADGNVGVRFAAVRGLLTAKDVRTLPVLIDSMKDLPQEKLWKAGEILERLAQGNGPAAVANVDTKKGRQQLVRAWKEWWREHRKSADLAALANDRMHLGRMLICEYDSVRGQPRGRIWECDRTGKQIWEITGLSGPMDAQVLPGGRVLIAENTGRRVVEMDRTGKVHWEYRVTSNPVACQRLPNGNTFIATYNQLLEVTPGKRVVFSLDRGPAFYIFSAKRLRNGRIVCMSAQGTIMEIDPATRKTIRSINLQASGWCGIDVLPNGRYLVAQMGLSRIQEIDKNRKVHWKCNYRGAFRATRLPNGHTLTASMSTMKVAEFDRNGNLIREIPCKGRPWQVRYR